MVRIYLDGPFDLGAVYGVDDAPVLAKRRTLLTAARDVFGPSVELIDQTPESPSPNADDVQTLPVGPSTPFGAGLRLRVHDGPLLELWRAAALYFLDGLAQSNDAEVDAAAHGRLRRLLKTIDLRDVTLFLFGVGAGMVRLRTGSFSVAVPEDARGVFKMLELGGYGDVDRGAAGAAMNERLAVFRDRARDILAEDNPAVEVTRRNLREGEVYIRGYQGLIVVEQSDPYTGREPGLFRPGETPVFLSYGPMTLGFGWLYIVTRDVAHFEVNLPRFLYIYMIARLAWDIGHRSERHFDELLKRRIAAALSGDASKPLSRPDLNLLKTLSHFIITATNLQSQTVFSGDLAFFEVYEQYARIQPTQRGIAASNAAFASAEEEEIFQIESRRARRFAALISVLTVVSLVGVAAEVLGSWGDGRDLLGGSSLLVAALSAPAIAGLVALLTLNWSGRRR